MDLGDLRSVKSCLIITALQFTFNLPSQDLQYCRIIVDNTDLPHMIYPHDILTESTYMIYILDLYPWLTHMIYPRDLATWYTHVI